MERFRIGIFCAFFLNEINHGHGFYPSVTSINKERHYSLSSHMETAGFSQTNKLFSLNSVSFCLFEE